MDVAVNQVRVNARRVITVQAGIAVVAAVVFGIVVGFNEALGALYGGAIGIASSLLLRRGVVRAGEIAATNPKKSLMVLYFGALQRFVLVVALFALGLGVFKLNPLAAVVGFGAAQLAYFLVMRHLARPGRR